MSETGKIPAEDAGSPARRVLVADAVTVAADAVVQPFVRSRIGVTSGEAWRNAV
jgi:hypothetical protein